jgi:TPR repeat protein/serine/threonine protein kinase
LNGRYRIERGLGEGGLGVVFVARDETLHDRRVVIKMPLTTSGADRKLVDRFAQEVKALAVIDHPGIVSALDSGVTEDGQPFLVMQYVDGRTLNEIVPQEGLPFDVAARILKQIGHALSAAHAQNILHRDLKPANVMLQRTPGGDEYVRLIDFGIASIRDSFATTETQTVVAGTLLYMAPEQLDGRVSVATDIYSFAVIAYELVTGRRPFSAKTAVSMVTLQRSGVRLRPSQLRPDIPPAAERLILQGLAYNPQDRPQNAALFADALAQALLDGMTVEADPSNATTRSLSVVQRTSRKFPSRAIVAAVLAMIGAIAVYVAWAQFRDREHQVSTHAPPAATPSPAPAGPSQTPGSEAERQPAHATATAPAETPSSPGRSTRATSKLETDPPTAVRGPSPVSRKISPDEACESGDVRSCFELAERYSQGRGVPKDDVRAATLYERSCSKGLAAGCYSLALAYRDERGVPKDSSRSAELLERGCSGGVSDACDVLGVALGAGNGVVRDDARAVRLFQQACDAGTGSACSHLAAWLSLGRGLPKDEAHATTAALRACDLGYLNGCVVAAGHYRSGNGVQRDLKRAAALSEQACNGGDSGGCNDLGIAYGRGEAMEADQAKSVELLQHACSMGNALACTNVGDHYLSGMGVKQDAQHATQIFQEGCEARVGRGCFMAAQQYDRGSGVPRNLPRAAELFQRSCDLRVAMGCMYAAIASMEGRGVEKDTTRAAGFLRQADLLGGRDTASTPLGDAKTGATGEFSSWMPRDEYDNVWNKHIAEGLRPALVEGRVNNGREEYRARWERTLSGCTFFQRRNISQATYDTDNAVFIQQGYRVSVTQFNNLAGQTMYVALWTKGCDSK